MNCVCQHYIFCRIVRRWTVCIRNVHAASVIRRQCCMIRILSGRSNSCQCKENNKRIYWPIKAEFMRMRRSILLILMIACVCSSFGQKERSINIYATIKDYILRTTIENAKVTLLSPDSVVLDSCRNNYGYSTLRKLYSFLNVLYP